MREELFQAKGVGECEYVNCYNKFSLNDNNLLIERIFDYFDHVRERLCLNCSAGFEASSATFVAG